MNHNDKREQIKKIKADSTLTEKEKNIKIQELMSCNYICSIQSKSNESDTCSHYNKKCSKFVFACCNLVDPCKRCHAERGCCKSENIVITQITCIECGLEQKPQPCCVRCGIQFDKSYCGICQIWTSKEIYHCVDCGICRIGSKETLTHCVDCAQCFVNNVEHVCSKRNYKDGVCVVCSESTFNSQSNSVLLPCNHFIHSNCLDQLISQSNYKCPHCKKSLCDMTPQWDYIKNLIKSHPLPNDMIPIELNDIVDTQFGKFQVNSIESVNQVKLFKGQFVNWFRDKSQLLSVLGTLNSSMCKKNLYKQIHCNDCGKKSTSVFHFYGMECGECGSFNTQE